MIAPQLGVTYSGAVPAVLAARDQPPAESSFRELGAEGAVRVYEYDCHATKGAPSRVEQFTSASLAIVCGGVFGFRSARDTELLTTDFALLGNPGQDYEISHEHAGGDRCLIFQLDEAVLGEIADARRRRSTRRYFARSVLPPLPRIAALRYLTEQRLAARGPALGLEELAITAASHAMAAAGTGALRPARLPEAGRRARDSVYRAIEWLERSVADDVHLADIARIAELTPFHFLRVFKHETGVTPYRFLIRARIRRAAARLTHTEQPITDIAYDVGFGDLSNFVHTFRRELGCSPSQFRRAVRAA
jgi:AraC-like DNA-binding protein